MSELEKVMESFGNLGLKNKGTGAGGAKTNENGKEFEKITSIEEHLEKNNFKKVKFGLGTSHYYYISEDNAITYFTQQGLKKMYKEFNIWRYPDEAYMITKNGTTVLKILEKKNQNAEGSVDEKLQCGEFRKREYHEMFKGTIDKVELAFCLSEWFYKRINNNEDKWNFLKSELKKNNIPVFCGSSETYIQELMEWVNA